MRKIEKRSDCPISYSLDLLGDKWTMLILRDLALNNKHFYKEFLAAGEGIATNVLSDRLKMLESFQIIQSKPYPSMKTMKYYSLTEKGIALIPILIELWVWGATFDPHTSVSTEEIQGRQARRKEILEALGERARKQD